jgi:uncharacterized membrane protein YfcA
MLALTIFCGIVVGLSLGLTGGGGSILAVPLLVYGLAVAPQEAVSISLGAGGATSLAGAVQRLWRREVEIKTGLIFAGSGMLGAPLGTWIGGHISETLLLGLFAALMVVVAVRMWRKASRSPAEAAVIRAATEPPFTEGRGPACRRDPSGHLPLTSRCMAVLLASGVMTGVLSGLFGVGGGFVIVPALVLLTSLDIHRAVATSLLVIAVISGAGLASHLYAGRSIELATAVPFAGGGVAGLGIGTWAGRRIPAVRLQKGFSIVILAVAAYVIVRSLS